MSVARCWTTGMDTHVHVCMPVPLRVLNSGAHIWPTLHITYIPHEHAHTHTHSWVVPHNVFLATKYNCHINVEVVSSIKAVKYLYKYVYKGPDRCTIEIGPVDEIKQFMDARYVAAPEAAWRIFGFELYDNKPAVYRLAIHTPEEQSVVFDETDDPNDVAARAQSSLLAYFEAMRDYPESRHMKYQDMHKEFVYHKTGEHKGTWTPRTRGQTFPTVGRIYNISRSQGEVYFIRLLLLHTPGVTGWEHLRTVDDIVCETFEDACRQLGLLDDDSDHIAAFREAREFATAPSLRQLFATILTTGCSSPLELWNQYKRDMIDDYFHEAHRALPAAVRQNMQPTDALYNRALLDLDRRVLGIQTRRITELIPGLPPLTAPLPMVSEVYVQEELQRYDRAKLQATVDTNVPLLNADQREVYDTIMQGFADGAPSGAGGLAYFVQGPGGTGKTFLLNTLLAAIRVSGNDKLAIATGSSGICATLLDGGRTAHSRFGLPFTPHEQSTCSICRESPAAELLRQADFIVWDEVTMAHKHVIEAFDRLLKDLMQNQRPFGGKLILFAGDYAQCLAVVRRGNRAQIISAQACKSNLWARVMTLKLNINMRAQAMVGAEQLQQTLWAAWLQTLGRGEIPYVVGDTIRLPDDLCFPENSTLDDLIEYVYPNLSTQAGDMDYFNGRAIVTAKNKTVDSLNAHLIDRMNGELHQLLSADSVDADHTHYVPQEYLNTLVPSGLPPHRLPLKVGMPIMLLRNLDMPIGLCNGARLILRTISRSVLEADISSGPNRGQRVLIPRISLSPSEQEYPFTLTRRQFPIRPAFAMTINKCQGQTVQRVGVYLPEPVFTHGQLYVAASRAPARDCIRFFVPYTVINGQRGPFTRNVVFTEVLQG
jgi:hypothetical protein